MDDDLWEEDPPNPQDDEARAAGPVDPRTNTPAFPGDGMRGVGGVAPYSLEEQIERLNKRLKRNLPKEVRGEIEDELARLKRELKACQEIEAARQRGEVVTRFAAAVLELYIHRLNIRVGALEPGSAPAADPDDLPTKVKKKKFVNRAAPGPPAHPNTMNRMQGWKEELDRRIKEQDKISKAGGAKASSQLQSAVSDNPLTDFSNSVSAALTGLVDNMSKALGLASTKEEEEEDDFEVPRTLPPQTFSRRL